MSRIRKTDIFKKYMHKLKDHIAKAHINRRIDRLDNGNPGEWKSVGDGICEMIINYGPGYRIYYTDTGREIIIILCAGDKSSQQDDIDRAKRLAQEEEEYYENK